MKSAAAVFAIAFLMTSTVFSQVHIRESATITPGQTKKIQAGVDHTIRFEFYWSAGADSARVKYFATPIYGCNPDTFVIVKQDGPIVVELESPAAGAYGFSYRAFLNASPPPQFSIQARLFWDDSLVDSCWNYAFYGSWSAEGNCSTYSQDTWMGFCTPFSSSFELSLYPWPTWWQPMYYGKSAGITLYDQSDCNSKTAWYPEDPFTLTIISGGQYASFHTIDPQTGNDVKLDSVVNATGQSILAGQFYLVADSIQPDSVAEWVVVQGESDGLTNLDSIAVFPPPVAVTFDPPEIGPGDTTNIITKQRNADGSLADFPDNQLFEIGIWSGNKYGTILSSGDTAGYFINVPQGFKFIAVDSIDADSVAAGIRVGVIPPAPSSIMPGNNKSSQADSTISKSIVSVGAQPFVLKKPATDRSSAAKGHQSVSSTNNFIYDDDYGIGYVTIKREHTILLGQTKYYQAISDPNDGTKLTFAEMSKTTRWTPGGQAAQFTVTPVSPTDTLAAYYELRDEDGTPLAGDMIRLVGRYWGNDGKAYKVKLSATSGSRSGSVDIEVKKPARLLTPGQFPTYGLSKDVFNHPVNIDSICIYFGGKYGIPPQFLKGQMLKEAGKIDLDDGEQGLAPSYRYEPFTMQLSKAWKTDSRYNSGLWVVDPNRTGHEMGTGKEVPIHQNVQDMPYPRSPKTVWDILWDNSELVNTSTNLEHKVYGKRLPSGKMVFPSQYKKIIRKYNDFLNVDGSLASLFSSKSKEEIAREKMIEYFYDEWQGGAKNMVAQTRLASSYGLLQMLYSTAVETEEMGYPSLNPNISPEDFNVTDTNMTYSVRYMKNLLRDGLTPTVENQGNWPNGFEYWFKNEIWGNWNTDPTYPGIVYSYTQKFLPQSK